LWILGLSGIFSFYEKRLRSTYTWNFIWTTDWTGNATLRPSTRRDITNCIFEEA